MDSRPGSVTERQRWALYRMHPDKPKGEIDAMSTQQASDHIGWHAEHWRKFHATERQIYYLRLWSAWQDGMDRGRASELIARIKEHCQHWDQETHDQMHSKDNRKRM